MRATDRHWLTGKTTLADCAPGKATLDVLCGENAEYPVRLPSILYRYWHDIKLIFVLYNKYILSVVVVFKRQSNNNIYITYMIPVTRCHRCNGV